MSGNFIYRHHVEPRVKLYSPREESFLVPLKYIDVSRTAHTNLEVMQESRIDVYWNIDGSRDLSDSWTGFTQFTLLSEKPPDGYMWSGVRLTKRQATSRPDHLWTELWRGMSKNAKLREKSISGQLKNQSSIMQEDYKESVSLTLKKKIGNSSGSSHALQDLQEKTSMVRPVARLMISSINLHVSWKLVNPQGCVWKKLHRNIMRTILQEEVTIHYNITIWYTNLCLCLKPMKILAAKAAVDKEWEKLEKIPTWDKTQVKSKSEVVDEARTKGIKVHFASLMDICHLKNAELETKHQKFKGRAVLRGDIVNDDSGSYALFTEQGSSACSKSHGYHIQTARVRRTSS